MMLDLLCKQLSNFFGIVCEQKIEKYTFCIIRCLVLYSLHRKMKELNT